ncbi:hypothetical protein D3C80_276450 [compost metagenome]
MGNGALFEAVPACHCLWLLPLSRSRLLPPNQIDSMQLPWLGHDFTGKRGGFGWLGGHQQPIVERGRYVRIASFFAPFLARAAAEAVVRLALYHQGTSRLNFNKARPDGDEN